MSTTDCIFSYSGRKISILSFYDVITVETLERLVVAIVIVNAGGHTAVAIRLALHQVRQMSPRVVAGGEGIPVCDQQVSPEVRESAALGRMEVS